MWRGAVRWPAFLGGDTMVSTGWMTVGKTVIYPVRPPDGGAPTVGDSPASTAWTPADASWNARSAA